MQIANSAVAIMPWSLRCCAIRHRNSSALCDAVYRNRKAAAWAGADSAATAAASSFIGGAQQGVAAFMIGESFSAWLSKTTKAT
jgi:branched-subunit amino acid ABC-type transport system permease component